MEKIQDTPAIYHPRFTQHEIACMQKYFLYYEQYYWKINEALTPRFADHPVWGPLLNSIPPEMRVEQNKRSLAMQRAAIIDGDWDTYVTELMTQGIVYARMNIAYSEWYEIVQIYKDFLIPYVKQDFSDNFDEAIAIVEGLSKFIDYVMYGIAEAYFQEKNNLLKAKEEQFRAIFENSGDYIILLDDKGVIQLINHTREGIRKEDILGKSIYDLQTPDNVEITRKAIQMVYDEKEPAYYDIAVNQGGHKVYYSSSVSPILAEDGSVKAAVVISRDVTKQKMAEAEVMTLNMSLEQKVADRTEELKKTNQELEAFSYTISHDLRNPLRAINGFAQILLEDHHDKLDDEAQDAIHEIVSNADRMGRLIDDLLEFSRLGKQDVVKRLLDMNDVVEAAIADLKLKDHPKQIKLDIHRLEQSKGDRAMLKQVMINLISNAVKYSGKKDAPAVEIGSYKEGGHHVYYVKDNGAGFDMAYYNKLFGVFQRLHGSHEFEGTGVGLAIVHRIVSKHAGKVWAEGKVGEGACFYISLPN